MNIISYIGLAYTTYNVSDFINVPMPKILTNIGVKIESIFEWYCVIYLIFAFELW